MFTFIFLAAFAVFLFALVPAQAEEEESDHDISKIIIEKVTVPEEADQSFSFETSWGDDFSLEDGDDIDFDFNEIDNPYEITETVPDGWTLDISCETDGGSSWEEIENGVSIELAEEETIHCVFTNTSDDGEDGEEEEEEEQSTQCSDGIDNDDDGLIDTADPACHTDGDANNVGSYNPELNDESNDPQEEDEEEENGDKENGEEEEDNNEENNEPAPNNGGGGGGTGGGGGGGSGGGGIVSGPLAIGYQAPGGEVLGVETTAEEEEPESEVLGESCGLYMDRFIRAGRSNDVAQVEKLQAFLNKWTNAGLPITGFYGPLTLAAVNNFQSQYASEILTPWELTEPTGIVYVTTLRWINQLECPELALALPGELTPWSDNASIPSEAASDETEEVVEEDGEEETQSAAVEEAVEDGGEEEGGFWRRLWRGIFGR